MSFNLMHYSLEDRDGDGQSNDPKPRRESRAVAEIVARAQPDILLVQEIGNPVIYANFRDQLAENGVAYPEEEYLDFGRRDNNIALLSRYPIVQRRAHTNDTYSIGDSTLHVARGIIDVDLRINANYNLRIMSAHLKSKVYHPLGQTEMRRNEARILGQYVRGALKQNPDLRLLVAGDMNDLPGSAALREIMGPEKQYLRDLRPADDHGDAWTHRNTDVDIYQRLDYMLASPNLYRDFVPAKTRTVDLPATRTASDHRPLLAVFRTYPKQ